MFLPGRASSIFDPCKFAGEVEEKNHTKYAHGTKRALLAGANSLKSRLTQQYWNPKLQPPGGAWIPFALPDIWKRLEDMPGQTESEHTHIYIYIYASKPWCKGNLHDERPVCNAPCM